MPRSPQGADIDANIAEAQSLRALTFNFPLGTAAAMTWFYGQVRNRGPWDYKQVKLLEDGGTISPASPFKNFGNFNYGATGAAAGFPSQLLLRAAGWAQARARDQASPVLQAFGRSPYGDDPHDQVLIALGEAYARNGCRQ